MKKTLTIVVLAVIATVLVMNATPAAAKPDNCAVTCDSVPRTAIVSAFGAELEAYKAAAKIDKVVVLNGRSILLGTMSGHKVLMTLSGESEVNAAMTTQLLFDKFNVTRLVFSGIAGGVNPALNIGDVVVPARWAEYQENLFAREVAGSFQPPSWFTPVLPNFGMMFPEYPSVTVGHPDVETPAPWFYADQQMVNIATHVAQKVTLNKCTPDGSACLTEQPIIKTRGNGVSGPTFEDNAEYRAYAWATWQTDALDMESASVAHVASVNHKPFIIFRSLSDLAGGGPGENQIGIYFGLAAGNSAKMMIPFIAALPK